MNLIPGLAFIFTSLQMVHALEWQVLGCYKDSYMRTLPHLFRMVPYNPAKPNYKFIFLACREIAEILGYTTFGVQHMNECWGSEDGWKTYSDLGCEDNCKVGEDGYGVGGAWSSYVYRVKQDWTKCYNDECLQYDIDLRRQHGLGCPAYNREIVVNKEKSRPCDVIEKCRINGGWSEYSDWTNCSKPCGGGGTRERTRSCSNPAPWNGGKDCEGSNKETGTCGEQPCLVPSGLRALTGWRECTKACAGGTREVTRTCTDLSRARSYCEGKETKPCYTQPCPDHLLVELSAAQNLAPTPAVVTACLLSVAFSSRS